MEKKTKAILMGGFIGGSIMPLFELMNIISSKGNLDIYFFYGVVVAGAIGIVGSLMTSSSDLKSCITAGISAPALLGGAVKVVPTAVASSQVFLQLMFGTPIYADTTTVDTTITQDTTIVIQEQEIKQEINKTNNFLRGIFGAQFRD
jgi:hypothetical protein